MKIFFILCLSLCFLVFDRISFQRNVPYWFVFLLFMFVSVFISSLSSSFYKMMAIFTFLMIVSYQDIQTYYYSKIWFLLILLFTLGWVCHWHYFCGLFYFLCSYCLYRMKKEWLGSMDCMVLTCFGLILGFERMIVCLLISILCGLVYHLFSKNKMIPFVSCLCIGFFISLLRGFQIYVILIS